MTPLTAAYPGVKGICEMGAIHLVEFFIEEMFILYWHMELRVHLIEDVVDGNAIGMDLLDVDVPG